MARELKAGDRLRMLGGVVEIESIETDKTQPVYNLDVAQNRDFFVGTRGYWSTISASCSRSPSRSIARRFLAEHHGSERGARSLNAWVAGPSYQPDT